MPKRQERDTRPSSLTPRQERFVAEYLVDLNATQAAIRAGYSAKTANREGSRLLSKVDIAARIAAGRSMQLRRLGITSEHVKERLAVLAFQDVRQFFDSEGNVIPITALPAEVAAQVGSIEVVKKNAEAGDGHTDRVVKIRFIDPVRPLEILAKYFGVDKPDPAQPCELPRLVIVVQPRPGGPVPPTRIVTSPPFLPSVSARRLVTDRFADVVSLLLKTGN